MPLNTPEEKKNALKWILSQVKMYTLTVLAAGGTVWGVAEIYLETYVRDTAIEVIEDKNGNKSFREILGEQLQIPTDLVPYHLTRKLTELDSLIKDIRNFEEEYLPYLERQTEITPIYRFIDSEGQEWWMGPDGYPHGVMYDEDGRAWCVYHNSKRYI